MGKFLFWRRGYDDESTAVVDWFSDEHTDKVIEETIYSKGFIHTVTLTVDIGKLEEMSFAHICKSMCSDFTSFRTTYYFQNEDDAIMFRLMVEE